MNPRPRPSMQTMRPVDSSHISSVEESFSNHSKRAFETNDRSGGIQSFHWNSSRRPSTPKPIATAKEQPNGVPPLPDTLQRIVHSPSQLRLATPRQCSQVTSLHVLIENKSNGSHTDHSHARNPSRNLSPVSISSSDETYETHATSLELPALQTKSALELSDQMRPLSGDMAGSFDLVAPPEAGHQPFSLETRSVQLFSREHLEIIFSDPSLLLRFTAFLSNHRPQSVPILIYYLDALKALKAINYANAIAEALSPIAGHGFTRDGAGPTLNSTLEAKARQAFDVMVMEELPAYVTQIYIQIVSLSIAQRITGTLAPHLREASEGLAEVFCLTDPSRVDNPIIFASEGLSW